MKYFVYVIKSSEGLKYIGMTEDLTRRLQEHNFHLKSIWTKRGKNWELVYTEVFENKADALKREKWLKGGFGLKYLKAIGVK